MSTDQPVNGAMVSLIVPLYNKGKYIDAVIESVQHQSYTAWEMIIVDDASTDDSFQKAKEQASRDARIRVFRNPQNAGGNFCRNEGIRKATGEYIIFLDSDDLLAKECLMNRVAAMEKHPSIDAGVFTLGVFTDNINAIKRSWVPKEELALQRFLAHELPWQTMQPIWRKTFITKAGGFDETFPRLQDVEFHTRALLMHNLHFKTFPGDPDCFFRTAEERKNFDTTSFLHKWVTGAVLYYKKFSGAAKAKGLDKFLNGTLYHTYMQLLWAYKQRRISKDKFRELKQLLFDAGIAEEISLARKAIFSVAGFYNLLPVRIPGINLALTKLITF